MAYLEYWPCPVYDHRWPVPPDDFPTCHYCQTNPDLKAYAEENGLSHVAAYTRPGSDRFEKGYVKWCWECDSTTSEGVRCGWMVSWEEEECHNPLCGGPKTKATWSTNRDRPALFYAENPTVAPAEHSELSDAQKKAEKAKKAAGKKHRPVDGCPDDCPGPHDFTLVLRALAEQEGGSWDDPIEVVADVLPPVDPAGGPRAKGTLLWALTGDAKLRASGAGKTTTDGDQNRQHVVATKPGGVVLTCAFKFGKETFPDKKRKDDGPHVHTLALQFGEVVEPGLYGKLIGALDACLEPLAKYYEMVDRGEIAHLFSSNFALLTDAWVQRFVDEVERRIEGAGGDAPAMKLYRERLAHARKNAKRVLHFRRRVAEAPAQFARVVNEVRLGFEGREALMLEACLPLAKRIVAGALATPPGNRQRKVGADEVRGLDPPLTVTERRKFGVLSEKEIRALDRKASLEEVSRVVTFPAIGLARAILYEDGKRLAAWTHGTVERVYDGIKYLADALRWTAEGTTDVSLTPEHKALHYLMTTSDEFVDGLYRAFYGHPEKTSQWWPDVNWYHQPGHDPDAQRSERVAQVKKALAKIDLPAVVHTRDLRGLVPHYDRSDNGAIPPWRQEPDGFDVWSDPYE